MQPLATRVDLANRGISASSEALADALLEAVSAAIRDAAGSPITQETSTVTMWTEPARRIELPARPVISVASVSVDGEPVADWTLRGSALWRSEPWQARSEPPRELVVTFTHGYATVPADIVQLACVLVAAGLAAADGDGFGANRGKTYTSIDDYREGFATGSTEVVDPTEIPERTRLALRRRFGRLSSAVVDGAR